MSVATRLARTEPDALAARLEQALGRGLGAPVHVAVATTGPAALAGALAAAGRATDSVAGWPCPYASLSHSGDVAVAVALPVGAFAAGLGVDLELDRPVKSGLARLICDARELAWIGELPIELQAGETLRLWTAKEAMYKADPAQGDAIVADYAIAVPSAAVSDGHRAGAAARARVVSVRIADATVSVALRPTSEPEEDTDVATR